MVTLLLRCYAPSFYPDKIRYKHFLTLFREMYWQEIRGLKFFATISFVTPEVVIPESGSAIHHLQWKSVKQNASDLKNISVVRG